MKQIILSIILLSILSLQVNAQQPKAANREQLYQLKKEIYNKVLDLNETDQAKFWPVFNAYNDDLDDLKYQFKKQYRAKSRDANEWTEADYKEAVYSQLAFEQQKLDLKKKYVEKMLEVLPAAKVYLIPRAEAQYKKALLQKIKEKREMR